jgi:PAS domain S-box-containing protein
VSFEFSKFLPRARQTAASPDLLWRYGIAIAAVFAATNVWLVLESVAAVNALYLPFVLSVVVAALAGGRGPGFAAGALSVLVVDGLFLKPPNPVSSADSARIWMLGLFVVSVALIAWLGGDFREYLLARSGTEEVLRRQAQLIDLSPDGVITMDSQRRIITWNKGAEEMYGWPERDAVGKVFHQLLQTAGDNSILDVDEILERERRWDGELSQMARDGRRIVVESRQVLFGGGTGLPACILTISRDITERKQTEERLRQVQKLESVGLLAGGIANDFNNLLTVILGNAYSALTKYPSCEEARHIITASERAANLTRQLLAYAGKGQFISETFDLTDLVTRCTDLLSAAVPKRVKLSFNLWPGELLIKADPSQIEQVLMNLVINAGEAIPPHTDGRIEIAASPSEVEPEVVREHVPASEARPKQFVCLEVSDNGSGIDEEILSQIFDPFFSTKFAGRGLGLAAAHGIVRSCNGFIDVESSRGAGSKFRVFLPTAEKALCARVPAGTR